MVGSVTNGAIDPTPIDLILPVRGRARAEILARTLPWERYAASGARQRALTKGPGKDSSGGVTFRPRQHATLPNLPKHQGVRSDSFRGTRYGWSPRAVEVTGGLAWTQWLITLTGESPTPSLVPTRVSQTYKHCEGVGRRGGAVVGPNGGRFGDGSCSGVASQRKEHPCVREDQIVGP